MTTFKPVHRGSRCVVKQLNVRKSTHGSARCNHAKRQQQKPTSLAERPHVDAGLQSHCPSRPSLHPGAGESSEERPLFLRESETIKGEDESKGQTTWREIYDNQKAEWRFFFLKP